MNEPVTVVAFVLAGLFVTLSWHRDRTRRTDSTFVHTMREINGSWPC